MLDTLNKEDFVPIYYQIGNMLKAQILSGELKPSSKLPSEKELAKQYGVAKLTLRNALGKLAHEGLIRRHKGKGTFIADTLPAEEKTISILVDRNVDNMPSSLSRVITGVVQCVKEYSCNIRIDTIEDLNQLLDKHKSRELKLDGFITVRFSKKSDQVAFKLLANADIPFVSEGVSGSFNSVEIDNTAGITKAFQYLLDLGHTEIGIGSMENSEKNKHVLQRVEIGRQLISAEFGEVREDYCFTANYNSDVPPMIKARTFLQQKKKPTALLCVSDLTALPLVTQAPFAGVSVPEDISIIGFEDMEACQHVYPTLTTIKQDYFMQGYISAEMLLAKMKDCNHRKIHRKVIPELIIRASCAKPKDK